jgi:hypothetical protein
MESLRAYYHRIIQRLGSDPLLRVRTFVDIHDARDSCAIPALGYTFWDAIYSRIVRDYQNPLRIDFTFVVRPGISEGFRTRLREGRMVPNFLPLECFSVEESAGGLNALIG